MTLFSSSDCSYQTIEADRWFEPFFIQLNFCCFLVGRSQFLAGGPGAAAVRRVGHRASGFLSFRTVRACSVVFRSVF
jgi:hypothetical protein